MKDGDIIHSWHFCQSTTTVCGSFQLMLNTYFLIHVIEVYHYDLSKMGVLAALPYILLSIGMLTIGQLYDRILAKNWVTVTVLRKICIGGSYLIEACFMIGTIYWENIAGNVFCMVIAVSTSSISKAAVM